MALAILFIGILLVASGIKGTEHELGTQLSNDLTGIDGFLVWLGAIVLLGLVSKIPGFETPSKYFLALVLVAVLLNNSNFITNLQSALTNPSQDGVASLVPLQTGSSSSSSNGAGANVGGAIQTASLLASVFG
jgi:hypothetical protein